MEFPPLPFPSLLSSTSHHPPGVPPNLLIKFSSESTLLHFITTTSTLNLHLTPLNPTLTTSTQSYPLSVTSLPLPTNLIAYSAPNNFTTLSTLSATLSLHAPTPLTSVENEFYRDERESKAGATLRAKRLALDQERDAKKIVHLDEDRRVVASGSSSPQAKEPVPKKRGRPSHASIAASQGMVKTSKATQGKGRELHSRAESERRITVESETLDEFSHLDVPSPPSPPRPTSSSSTLPAHLLGAAAPSSTLVQKKESLLHHKPDPPAPSSSTSRSTYPVPLEPLLPTKRRTSTTINYAEGQATDDTGSDSSSGGGKKKNGRKASSSSASLLLHQGPARKKPKLDERQVKVSSTVIPKKTKKVEKEKERKKSNRNYTSSEGEEGGVIVASRPSPSGHIMTVTKADPEVTQAQAKRKRAIGSMSEYVTARDDFTRTYQEYLLLHHSLVIERDMIRSSFSSAANTVSSMSLETIEGKLKQVDRLRLECTEMKGRIWEYGLMNPAPPRPMQVSHGMNGISVL